MMAVRAGGDGTRLLLPKLSFDDLGVHLFDPGMALGAGCGDVPGGYGGPGVGMGKDEVVTVAVIAGGGHDQTLFEQSHAVDALRVVGEDVFFRDVVDTGYGRPLPVTFPTQDGDVHLVGAGLNILVRKDVMFPVAFGTSRSIRGPTLQSFAVDSSVEFFAGLIVADAAVDLRQAFRVRKFFDIRILVAGRAVLASVDRCGIILEIDVKGDRPSCPDGSQLGIFVADRAVFVGLRPENKRKADKRQDDSEY